MVNKVKNVVATGSWQPLTDIPVRCRTINIQARTAADCYYRYDGQDDYWTVKSGQVGKLLGQLNANEVYVMASNGVVIEVEYTIYGQLY